MLRVITRTVWILSLVSLFTDIASEMLYPIMPLYLKSIGFSIALIGVLEGIAEAIAGLSKGYFGKLSDVSGKRLPFVQWGYFLSAVSKPMMAIFTFPAWIFSARTLDRLGKGLRTGARDALLSDEATPKTKGTVFGFHRAMDTLGAVIGPAIALAFLYFNPGLYRPLFLYAFIPGLIAVLVSALIKEKKKEKILAKTKVSFFAFRRYWEESPYAYKKLVTGLLLFALVNSSDVFLLLMLKSKGINDTGIISIYIFYNLTYALSAFPMGALGDRIGLKKILLFGLSLFAVVYAGMAFAEAHVVFYFLFFLYGVYGASTEGIAKALISNITSKKDTATAVGTFAGLNSIAALFASTIAGFIWNIFGPQTMFLVAAIACVMAIIYLLSFRAVETEVQ
jgi:MFS family permease